MQKFAFTLILFSALALVRSGCRRAVEQVSTHATRQTASKIAREAARAVIPIAMAAIFEIATTQSFRQVEAASIHNDMLRVQGQSSRDGQPLTEDITLSVEAVRQIRVSGQIKVNGQPMRVGLD